MPRARRASASTSRICSRSLGVPVIGISAAKGERLGQSAPLLMEREVEPSTLPLPAVAAAPAARAAAASMSVCRVTR
jgi:hypothetical protein